jgi:hypothetical protein
VAGCRRSMTSVQLDASTKALCSPPVTMASPGQFRSPYGPEGWGIRVPPSAPSSSSRRRYTTPLARRQRQAQLNQGPELGRDRDVAITVTSMNGGQ